MTRLIHFFLNRDKLVHIVSFVICLAGLLVLFEIKRDLHPPMDFEIVQVNAQLPGASPQEIETLITFPIEESLKGLIGVKSMTSSTSEGNTTITVEYEPGHPDMALEPENIRQRIAKISHRLPKDMYPVQVGQEKMSDVFLAAYVFRKFDPLNPDHRSALKKFQSQVEQIKGVVSTELDMEGRDLYIRFDQKKLRDLGISMAQVRNAVSEYFSFIPLGRLRRDEKEWAVELKQPSLEIESLKKLSIVANRIGRSIELQDVASVEWASGEKHTIWAMNGEEVAWFDVKKDTVTDSIELYEQLSKKIETLKTSLPAPIELAEIMNGSRFIKQQLAAMSSNGLQGLLIVFILLALFLHWRLALMAAFGVPIAYLGSFIVLRLFGISLDLLSIIGLIIVSGVLVDDAIIISEMYCQNLEKGFKPKEAALRAVKEMILPVSGTIITTILAFTPILLIKGSLTWFLAAIPIVLAATLGFSWFETFFILPNHLSHFVTEVPKDYAKNFFDKLRALYAKGLGFTIRYRYAAMIVAMSMFAGSVWLAQNKLEHYFNVSIGSEQVKVYLTLKKSESLEETEKIVKPLAEYFKSLSKDDVDYYWMTVGRQWRDGRRFIGYRYVEFTLNLNKESTQPSVLKKKVEEQVKAEIEKFRTDGFEELTTQGRMRGQENYKKDMVSVKIEGTDNVNFAEIEKDVAAAVEKKGPIQELVTDSYRYQEGWQFEPNLLELARYRLTRYDLGTQLRQFFSPHLLAQIRHNGETIEVLTEVNRASKVPKFEELQRFEVITPMGTSVPLAYLGHWVKVTNLKSIDHKNGLRTLNVDFRYNREQANSETAKSFIQENLKNVIEKYPGFLIRVGDANEEDAENKTWVLKVILLCFLLIVTVLVFVLGSFTQPAIVVLPIPLGITGALLALYVHGHPLTLMAMIGLLGVIGIAVNDSIVMVHQINQSKDENGRLQRSAIIDGAVSRLRAIFLTSVTTVAGVIPVAYGLGGESGFTQPIAFTMGFGLLSSTSMTLLLLPALLAIREDLLNFVSKVFKKKTKSAEPVFFEVPPSVIEDFESNEIEKPNKSSRKPDSQSDLLN